MERSTHVNFSPTRRVLGKSGIAVSEIGLGCWAIGGLDWNLGLEMGWGGTDDAEAVRALRTAIELGGTHFDTADIYGHGKSERLLGTALSAIPRNKVIIGTKVGYFAGTAANAYHPIHLRHQLETSLSNIGTDYIDIYYFHNFNFGPDDVYLAPAIETFWRFKEEGKIRAIGMRGPHRYAAERAFGVKTQDKYGRFFSVADKINPDVIQLRYNVLTPTYDSQPYDIFAWTNERKIGVVMNKPFAQGLLLDKYDPDSPPKFSSGDHRNKKEWFRPDALRELRERLAPIKARFGNDIGELVRVALQYCLARAEHVCVVAGFRNTGQVEMNLGASGRPLTEDDVQFIRTSMTRVNTLLGNYFGAPSARNDIPNP